MQSISATCPRRPHTRPRRPNTCPRRPTSRQRALCDMLQTSCPRNEMRLYTPDGTHLCVDLTDGGWTRAGHSRSAACDEWRVHGTTGVVVVATRRVRDACGARGGRVAVGRVGGGAPGRCSRCRRPARCPRRPPRAPGRAPGPPRSPTRSPPATPGRCTRSAGGRRPPARPACIRQALHGGNTTPQPAAQETKQETKHVTPHVSAWAKAGVG